jgi:poly-gamma-glutamate synthesis protein (capsule biosynthesis protein)
MHPANIGCLTAARLDVVSLANNHVLDFQTTGLIQTLDALSAAGVRVAGAGRNLDAAQAPAIVTLLPGSRAVIFACGTESSGILRDMAADDERAGVDLLPDLTAGTADAILERVRRVKRPRDVVVLSIHWGGNWGYDVPAAHRLFAHRLIVGGVDIIHGHSSHHPRPVEIFRGRLILYGCGDFINDYEGISGYEEYRDDLTLMYFPTIDTNSGQLVELRLVPMQLRRFRPIRAIRQDGCWLRDRLNAVSGSFGAKFDLTSDGALTLIAR